MFSGDNIAGLVYYNEHISVVVCMLYLCSVYRELFTML